MHLRRAVLIVFLVYPLTARAAMPDSLVSAGRQPDPTAKTLSEIRAAEKRRIPLEVLLKASERYSAGGPVNVTVVLTNLFDAPLLMNSRMLVNHPLLKGEISFQIIDSNGKKIDIQRLITPLSIRDQDFVTLDRGESMQRAVDLSDLFGLTQKGLYKVQAAYHNDADRVGAQRAWRGVVWSEPIELRLE